MLEIIGDVSRGSITNEAEILAVTRRYGPGFGETLDLLVKRGYVDKRASGILALTKEGRNGSAL